MDITYVPMARGFIYLAAVLSWFSRKVLAWRLSITLSVDFCIEALEEALECHGRPEIFNSDQGSQFTSADLIKALKNAEVAISMDGKGAWRDNVFVKRLWRTIKYEEVHLRSIRCLKEFPAKAGPVEGKGFAPSAMLGGPGLAARKLRSLGPARPIRRGKPVPKDLKGQCHKHYRFASHC